VDDQDGPRETVAFTVSDVCTVDQADRGSVALAKIRRNAYDVVLLDVMMPEMSGIKALIEIRKIDPLVGVIILTGHAGLATAQEAIKYGANQYLAKPPNYLELCSAVRDNGEATRLRRRQAKKTSEVAVLNEVLKQEIDANKPHVWQGIAAAELVNDLNSPLSVVIGYSMMLESALKESDLGDPEARLKLVEQAHVVALAAQYCNQLSENWQATAKMGYVFGIVDLVEVAKEACSCLLTERSVSELTGLKALRVRGVRPEIMRVFQNLLKNSIESGATRVVMDFSNGDKARVRISDNGGGMTEEGVQSAMHGGFSSKENGPGLGINICRHLISAHGGALNINSVIGKGTSALLSLPVLSGEDSN